MIERVLANRLQHRKTQLTIARLAAYQAPTDERFEVVEELVPRPGDRLRIVERAAVGEHRQHAVQVALARAQSLVAPVDRSAQRALALREIDRALHLERETLAERTKDLGWRENRESRGDELDRERKAVEAAADLVHRCERVVLKDHTARGSELDEEGRRIVVREGLERKNMLGREAEGRTARREHLEVRRTVDEPRDVHGCRREVLEVVEEEKSTRSVECVRHRHDHVAAARLAHADRARDRARYELPVGHWGQPDEVYGPVQRGSRGDLERESALPCSARPGDRHEADVCLGEERLHARERVGPSDEPVVQGRKTCGRERLQRGEVVPEARGHELEELRCGHVLEPVAP